MNPFTKHTMASALLLSCLSMSGAAQAHHSWALYDLPTCKVIEGTVRTFEWNFPHTWLWVYVPNAKGGQDIWGFQGEPPSNLSEHGWTNTTLKKGDKIKIKFSPLKDGRNGGAMSQVTLPTGKVMIGPRGGADVCAK
ncbi:MAG: DUF6152 family protein [Steroidobacteraceae bacterium]